MQDVIKYGLVILLFAPAVIFAFKQKKWYLYLLCAFIGILPDEFAIELSSSLPLLTFERILILVAVGFWVYDKWKKRKFTMPACIFVYFGVNVLVSLANLHFGIGGEVKRIALMLFERILLMLMVIDFIEDRREFELCLDFMIMGSVALAVIGLVQTVFEFNIASALELVEARAYQTLTDRMGLVRAFATSNAISYGCYCAFMAFICYYRLEKTGRQRYSLALALNMVALLCTMSRSAWLSLAIVLVVLFIARPSKLVKRVLPALGMAIVVFAMCFFANDNLAKAVLETGKSTLNTVLSACNIEIPQYGGETQETRLPESDTTETVDPEPMQPVVEGETQAGSEDMDNSFMFELSDEFGLNANNATMSRMIEWTAVYYMVQEGRGLFGYGYNAFPRGMMHYFYPQFGGWTTATTLDVGLLSVVTESGFVGFAAYLGLFAFAFVSAFRRKGIRGTFKFEKLVVYMIPLYVLLNFMAAFSGPIWLFVGLIFASRKLEQEGLTEEGAAAEYAWRF